MPDELASRPGLFGRLRLRATEWFRQLLAPVDVPIWGGSGTSTSVAPGYPAARSMSALAAFPWVRACVRAKVDDVGGLPLVAVRGRGQTEQLDDHPFLALMRRPSPGVTETMLRRQLEADLVLTGNAYIWLRRVPERFELYRLHPSHMTAIVEGGIQVGWRYAYERRLSMREIYHVHDVSWSDTLTALYGESPIRTLHDGLMGVQASRKHAAKQADQGRPDVFITIDAQAGAVNAQQVGEQYEENARLQRRAFVVGRGIDAKPLTWSPKDLEMAELDIRVRDETLAVMRVPPSKAGIPQANYATSKVELRDYWGTLLVADLKLFEDAYTAIAHDVGGTLDITIKHDVSTVEALQTSYDQRQARAGFWVTVMGATPADAAAYEGFRDAPVGDVAGGQAATRPAKEVDDQPARQSAMLERALAAWLAVAAERLEGTEPDRNAEVLGLAGVLQLARVPAGDARQLADEVGSIVCTAAENAKRPLTELYPFSPAYARAVATRPQLELAAK